MAEPFLQRNMHPSVIVRAYHRAMEVALDTCDRMAIEVDTSNQAQMRGIIRSCLGTKMVSRFGDLMCDLAMRAVTTVAITRSDGVKEIDTKRYARVEKVRVVLLWLSVELWRLVSGRRGGFFFVCHSHSHTHAHSHAHTHTHTHTHTHNSASCVLCVVS